MERSQEVRLGRRWSPAGALLVAAGVAGATSHLRQVAADRRRLRLLSGVAGIADAATTIDETVRRLGEIFVPGHADVYVIDVLRDGDRERLAVAAHGPRAAEIEALLRTRGWAEMRGGRARLVTPVADADMPEARSAMVLPLRARGREIGAMALIVTEASGRRYTGEDLGFAELLAGRVGLALDNAGLFREIETLEAQQSAVLGALAEAVTIQNARGELVYVNDAAARALGFASARELLATPTAEIIDAFESFHEDGTPLRPEELPARRVLAGETAPPLLVRAVDRATGEERWRLTKATAVRDSTGRPELAVTVIEDVTDVKRAELGQRFLAQAGAMLASSLDYEETLALVARLAVPQLADWCAVSLPDELGDVRAVAVAHVDPEKVAFAREYDERYPTPPQERGGVAQVIRDGRSQVVNGITFDGTNAAVTDPARLAALRSIGMRALMIVPMVSAGRVIGAITCVGAESRRSFSELDREIAEELGRRAGTAVQHARLYTERSQIAQTLQASLLPDALPHVRGFATASLYRPAGEETFVGGDFFDAFETATGWTVLIGDVTGRGAEAAALTGQARHTLRTAGTLLDDPVAAIDQLNRALVQRHATSICTVAAVRLRARRAEIVCAGHPRPLLVRGGRAREVGCAGPMVGAWSDAVWDAETVALAPGDVLVLYTDGVTDTCGADGRFGHERLEHALRGTHDAAGAVAAVRTALERFERGPQVDDTAILAVERLVGTRRSAPRPVAT